MRYLILFLLFSVAFWACRPDEACISSATSRLVVDFYVATDTTPVRDTVRFLKISSPALADTHFWKQARETDRIFRVFLALNPDKDTTTFVFERANLPNDTLVLRYQRRYRLIAPDCPLEVSYAQLKVVRKTFDSVRVVNTELIEPSNDMDVQIIFPRR